MKEGEPPSPIPLERARRRRRERPGEPAWDIAGVALSLRTTAEPMDDVEFGAGQRFMVGLDQLVLSLELYPATSAARIQTSDVRIEVRQLVPPAVATETLPSDHESVLLLSRKRERELRISLTAAGGVALQFEATDPLPQDAPAEAEPPKTPDNSAQRKEAAQRITLSGRLGAAPAFRTTPKGVLVCRFPLAVHQDDESTAWHQVLAFGKRAEQLQEKLEKGQRVEVVGYRHEHEVEKRGGGSRLVSEILSRGAQAPLAYCSKSCSYLGRSPGQPPRGAAQGVKGNALHRHSPKGSPLACSVSTRRVRGLFVLTTPERCGEHRQEGGESATKRDVSGVQLRGRGLPARRDSPRLKGALPLAPTVGRPAPKTAGGGRASVSSRDSTAPRAELACSCAFRHSRPSSLPSFPFACALSVASQRRNSSMQSNKRLVGEVTQVVRPYLSRFPILHTASSFCFGHSVTTALCVCPPGHDTFFIGNLVVEGKRG